MPETPSALASSVQWALWMALWTPHVPPEELDPVLPDHVEHLIELERRGLVAMSGPLAEPDGTFRGEGVTVLRVGSEDEARALLDADPFVVAGLRSYRLARWTMGEGSIALTVRLSDSSFTVGRS